MTEMENSWRGNANPDASARNVKKIGFRMCVGRSEVVVRKMLRPATKETRTSWRIRRKVSHGGVGAAHRTVEKKVDFAAQQILEKIEEAVEVVPEERVSYRTGSRCAIAQDFEKSSSRW